MSIKSMNTSDLCAGIMLIEEDFRAIKRQVKSLNIIDFDKELKVSCSGVFQDQLQSYKKLIESSGVKERLKLVKENLKSCSVVVNLQDNDCQLDFVKDRTKEVNAIAQQKIALLNEKIGKFDRSLQKCCFLIDSHIAYHTINDRLVEMLSNDLTCMDTEELGKIESGIRGLEQDQKKWFQPQSRSLNTHLSTFHKVEVEDFSNGLTEIKSRLQREKFSKDIVFVLDGLKSVCQKSGPTLSIEQRFAGFPVELQWQIFKNAEIVTGEFHPSSFATVQCFRALNINMSESLDKKNEGLSSTLSHQACALFLHPEKAFVACVDTLKECRNFLDQESMTALIAPYLNDVDAIKKSAAVTAEPFGILKELIGLNMKSVSPQENISRLLVEAEQKGLNLQGLRGVYFWVWFFAHQKDSSAGGLTFGADNAHKDLDRLILAIDEATVTPEQLLQRYKSVSISTMGGLKAEIEKIKAHENLSVEQREGVVHEILSAAVRGGLALDKPDGIYYWVWAIASKTDSWARGNNWGYNNAHKNIDRLLEAIAKSN